MKNADTFKQYIWLVNTIQRAKKIDLKRIQKLWVNDDVNNGKKLSRTTFYRLKEAIEDMFGLVIECDGSHQYYIKNAETLKDLSTQNWMLQTLTANNIIIDGLSIKDRLVLEEIPSGLEYVPIIIRAIKNNTVLRMGYKKFKASAVEDKPYVTTIKPYCLKVFRQRWYLLGRSKKRKDALSFYALDRVTELKETKTKFEIESDFNSSQYFDHVYGVFIGNDPAEHVVLRAYGKMIPLLRSLPLHHSQKEIATEKDYSDFEYHLVPTFDFRQAILKEGHELQVIEPKSLRKAIKEELMASLKHYE